MYPAYIQQSSTWQAQPKVKFKLVRQLVERQGMINVCVCVYIYESADVEGTECVSCDYARSTRSHCAYCKFTPGLVSVGMCTLSTRVGGSLSPLHPPERWSASSILALTLVTNWLGIVIHRKVGNLKA